MIHKICLTHERSSLCKRFKVIKTISSKSFFCQINFKFFSQQIIILNGIQTLKTVKSFGSSINDVTQVLAHPPPSVMLFSSKAYIMSSQIPGPLRMWRHLWTTFNITHIIITYSYDSGCSQLKTESLWQWL